jgi:hypothetical protein
MSVAVQTHQTPAKFGVDTAQFEEIIAPKDEGIKISKNTSSANMDKESDTDGHSSKEKDKTSTKKDSKSYYSSEEDSYDDDFESDVGESSRKAAGKDTARQSPTPKRNSSRSPESVRTKSPSVISPRSTKKGKRKRKFKPYESPRSSSPGILVTTCLNKNNATTSKWRKRFIQYNAEVYTQCANLLTIL